MKVLWVLRLALLVAVVVGVIGLVILGRQPGNGQMSGYGGLFGLYWLQILIPLDAGIQVILAIATARQMSWDALKTLLLGLLVDACIVVILLRTFFSFADSMIAPRQPGAVTLRLSPYRTNSDKRSRSASRSAMGAAFFP